MGFFKVFNLTFYIFILQVDNFLLATQNIPCVSYNQDWACLDNAPKDLHLNLRIDLKQSQIDKLVDILYNVSDPDSHNYGKYLSMDEIHKMSKPTNESSYLVRNWINQHTNGNQGGNSNSSTDIQTSLMQDSIFINVPVSVAEKMLSTSFYVYKHRHSNNTLIRTPQYTLPKHIDGHVDLIHPTTYISNYAEANINSPIGFEKAPSKHKKMFNLPYVTIEEIRKLYNSNNYVPKVPHKNKIAVLGFLDQVIAHKDLSLFLQAERPDATNPDIHEVSIDNAEIGLDTLSPHQIQNQKGREGNLDIQAVVGMAYPIFTEFVNVRGSPPFHPDLDHKINDNEPFLKVIDYFMSLNDEDLPRTISISYGDDEQTVPADYARRVCHGFAKLTARGVSIITSSGDDGVGPEKEKCLTNDGRNIFTFLPQFPASCPFVTSVGATQNVNPEIAQSSQRDGAKDEYYSGGGFSNLFDRPSYQNAVVSSYLDTLGKTYAGLYNPKGRAYPDVAAQGLNFKMVWNGHFCTTSGTSVSAPIFTGIISLVNDYLLSKNLKPLGFLNPFLYKHGFKGLNDIRIGSSQGCGTPGFPALQGWDAVTGLGTPDLELLKYYAELVSTQNSHDDAETTLG